jgi:hypothetical protein
MLTVGTSIEGEKGVYKIAREPSKGGNEHCLSGK